MPHAVKELFGRHKSLAGREMIFLRRAGQRKWPRVAGRWAPRPIVRDYEGSWDERDTPSFFSRLRRVFG